MKTISKRNPNVELLRIITMMMVLVLHVDVLKIGLADAVPGAVEQICRISVRALCFVAVNTFVMISGWFGIRPSVKGFLNFIWQVAFFVMLLNIVAHFTTGCPIGYKEILQCIGLYDGGGWFVASYIGLYILSPVLNEYIRHEESKKRMFCLVITFFVFQLIWGDTLSVKFVSAGFSTFSFIGLYLLSGFLRRYDMNQIPVVYPLLTFVICAAVNTLVCYIAELRGNIAVSEAVFNYINPLVIAGAASLILVFTRIEIRSASIGRLINWTASSCFAAYLLHFGIIPAYLFYKQSIGEVFSCFSPGIDIIVSFLAIVGVFMLAIVVDQPRRLIWNKLLLPLFR